MELLKKGENMNKSKYIKIMGKKIFKIYLVYAFIFSILIFAFFEPKEKQYTKSSNLNNIPINTTTQDRVALVEERTKAGLTRLNLIANAKETLDISYYTILDGKSTEVFLGSILDAADRGVEVRILLDGLFHNLNGHRRNTIYAFKKHPNIKLKFYEPFHLLKPWSWNNRLHDKIIMVDEQLALIGGRNIGDKYFLEESAEINLVKDRDVLIFNPIPSKDSSSVILDMSKYYDHIWNHDYSKVLPQRLTTNQEKKGERYKKDLLDKFNRFKEEKNESFSEINWIEKTILTTKIDFVHNPIGRLNQDPWCLNALLNLASEAEKSVFIQSPYIIPSKNMKNKLGKYDIDLSKVSILTNSLASSPNPIAISGYSNHRNKIIDTEINLYEFQGEESLHAKTYIFDDHVSAIGSFNFDSRSTYINSESMVIIYSKDFVKQLQDNIDMDLKNSLQVDKNYSYVPDEIIKQKDISLFKKTTIGILSKCVYFVEYLL